MQKHCEYVSFFSFLLTFGIIDTPEGVCFRSENLLWGFLSALLGHIPSLFPFEPPRRKNGAAKLVYTLTKGEIIT
jgi:hypothetical protein